MSPGRCPAGFESGLSQPAAIGEEFGHLDGVGGSSLAEVVSGDSEVEAALVAGVPADAAVRYFTPPTGTFLLASSRQIHPSAVPKVVVSVSAPELSLPPEYQH